MQMCIEDCRVHNWPCDREAGHEGDHDCPEDLSWKKRQRAQQIADRVAAHRTYVDLIETVPDED